jgi:hypothetical protein
VVTGRSPAGCGFGLFNYQLPIPQLPDAICGTGVSPVVARRSPAACGSGLFNYQLPDSAITRCHLWHRRPRLWGRAQPGCFGVAVSRNQKPETRNSKTRNSKRETIVPFCFSPSAD